MKKRLIVFVCAVTVGWMGANRTFASSAVDPGAVIVDAVIARPLCLAVTVVGSVFFVISLPFSAPTKSVHRTADALIVWPAHEAFCRPLGDLDELGNY